MPLLQPVRFYEEAGETYIDVINNSQENLQTILSLIEGIDNPKEVIQRLQPMHQELISGWHNVLASYVVGMQDNPEKPDLEMWIARMLWRINQCDPIPEAGEDIEEQTGQMLEQMRKRIARPRGNIGPMYFVGLWPATDKVQALIRWSTVQLGPDPITDALFEDFACILRFEGVRQQLRRRRGIICPLSTIGHTLRCCCPARWYKAMKRLSKLAKDGAFGPGEWSSLPCKR
jgi:hypothetical protein